jgi:hypothetical protein
VGRRSNDFQRLIRRIYEQVTSTDTAVVESALVPERDSRTLREIDVLLKLRVGDVDLSVAVECRDRSRASDVAWIDQLIGKYARLPVDRVIGVSRSGFTPAARAKAQAHGIELRSIQEANDTNWPEELLNIPIRALVVRFSEMFIEFETDPPWPDEMFAATVKSRHLPGGVTSGEEFIQRARRLAIRHARHQMHSEGDYRKEALASKISAAVFSVNLDVPDTTLVCEDGTECELTTLQATMVGVMSVADADVRLELYGNVGITTGTIRVYDEECTITVRAIQGPGKAKVSLERIIKFDKGA